MSKSCTPGNVFLVVAVTLLFLVTLCEIIAPVISLVITALMLREELTNPCFRGHETLLLVGTIGTLILSLFLFGVYFFQLFCYRKKAVIWSRHVINILFTVFGIILLVCVTKSHENKHLEKISLNWTEYEKELKEKYKCVNCQANVDDSMKIVYKSGRGLHPVFGVFWGGICLYGIGSIIYMWICRNMSDALDAFRTALLRLVNGWNIPGGEDEMNKFSVFIQSIAKEKSLPEPYQSCTVTFMEDFSPTLIHCVLRSDGSKSEKIGQRILKSYIELCPAILDSEWYSFLEVFPTIFEAKWVDYYKYRNSAQRGENGSGSLLQENRDALKKTELLSRMSTYVRENTCTFRKFFCLLKLLESFGNNQLFPVAQIRDCCLEIADAIFQMVLELDVREIDETYVDRVFVELLNVMQKQKVSEKEIKEVEGARITLCIKMVRSELLAKQFAGLSGIVASMTRTATRDKEIGSRLAAEKVMDSLLGDLDPRLASDTMFLLAKMASLNYCGKPEVKAAWEVLVRQRGNQNDPYFVSWARFMANIVPSSETYLTESICETGAFPPIALQFLSYYGGKFSSRNNADMILQSLLSCLSAANEAEYGNLLIDAIEKFLEKGSQKVLKDVGTCAMNMLESSINVELSLKLVIAAMKYRGSLFVQNAYGMVLILCSESQASFKHYNSFLIEVMANIEDYPREDFEALLHVCLPYLESEPDEVCGFFVKLLEKQRILSSQMVQILLDRVSAAHYSRSSGLILACAKFLRKTSKPECLADRIWSFLTETKTEKPDVDLIEFVVELYIESHKLEVFMGFAISVLPSRQNVQIALLGVLAVIYRIEGTIRDSPDRHLVDKWKWIHISVSGVFESEMYVPSSMKLVDLQKKVASLLDVNTSRLVFDHPNDPLCNDAKLVCELSGASKRTVTNPLPTMMLMSERAMLFDLLDDDVVGDVAAAVLLELPDNDEFVLDERLWSREHPRAITIRTELLKRQLKIDPRSFRMFQAVSGNEWLARLLFANIDILDDKAIYAIQTIVKDKQIKLEPVDLSGLAAKSWTIEAFLAVLAILKQVVVSNPEFLAETRDLSGLLRLAFFQSSNAVASYMKAILLTASPKTYIKDILSLLPEANATGCVSVLEIIRTARTRLIEERSDISNALVKLIRDMFVVPNDASMIDRLMARGPSSSFIDMAFSILCDCDFQDSFGDLGRYLGETIFLDEYYHPIGKPMVNFLEKCISCDGTLSAVLKDSMRKYYETYDKSRSIRIVPDFSAKYKGLKNFGSTCYLNSALQQLFAIQEFRNMLLSQEGCDEEWFLELQKLFAEMLLYPSSALDTNGFISQFKTWDGEPIDVKQQQDCAEFIGLLFDRLQPLIPIQSIFEGKLKHEIHGVSCDFHQEKSETFMDLALHVKDQQDLSQAMKLFLTPEEFEYPAEGYGKIKAIRTTHVESFPEVLIIQLQRFNYNLSTSMRTKIDSCFAFPEKLDASSISVNPEVREEYILTGIIEHAGSANAGHYTSKVKVGDDWYTFNDALAEPAGADFLRSSYGGENHLSNAYLLFYKRHIESKPIAITERLLDYVSQQVKEAVSYDRHTNANYVRLLFRFDLDAALDVLLSRPKLLEGLCKDKMFDVNLWPSDTILESMGKHDITVISTISQPVISSFMKLVSGAVKSGTPRISEQYIDSLLTTIEKIEPKDTMTFVFEPIKAYLEVNRAIDDNSRLIAVVSPWITLFLIHTSWEFDVIWSVARCIAERSGGEKLLRVLPETQVQQVLKQPTLSVPFKQLVIEMMPYYSSNTMDLFLKHALSIANLVLLFFKIQGDRLFCEKFFSALLGRNADVISAVLKGLSKRKEEISDDKRNALLGYSGFVDRFVVNNVPKVRLAAVELLQSCVTDRNPVVNNLVMTLIRNLPLLVKQTLQSVGDNSGQMDVTEAYLKLVAICVQCVQAFDIIANRGNCFLECVSQFLGITDHRPLMELLRCIYDCLSIASIDWRLQFFRSDQIDYYLSACEKLLECNQTVNGSIVPLVIDFCSIMPGRYGYITSENFSELFRKLQLRANAEELDLFADVVNDAFNQTSPDDCDEFVTTLFSTFLTYKPFYMKICCFIIKGNSKYCDVFEGTKMYEKLWPRVCDCLNSNSGAELVHEVLYLLATWMRIYLRIHKRDLKSSWFGSRRPYSECIAQEWYSMKVYQCLGKLIDFYVTSPSERQSEWRFMQRLSETGEQWRNICTQEIIAAAPILSRLSVFQEQCLKCMMKIVKKSERTNVLCRELRALNQNSQVSSGLISNLVRRIVTESDHQIALDTIQLFIREAKDSNSIVEALTVLDTELIEYETRMEWTNILIHHLQRYIADKKFDAVINVSRGIQHLGCTPLKLQLDLDTLMDNKEALEIVNNLMI